MSHTPGPWRWELNYASKRITLCGGVPRYDLTVIDFVRWGMSGAILRLRRMSEPRLNIMEKADKYGAVVPGREHHVEWFQDIDHPDMRLIVAAPDLLAACQAMLEPFGYQLESALDGRRCLVCDALDAEWDGITPGQFKHTTNCPVPIAETAIARATGEEVPT